MDKEEIEKIAKAIEKLHAFEDEEKPKAECKISRQMRLSMFDMFDLYDMKDLIINGWGLVDEKLDDTAEQSLLKFYNKNEEEIYKLSKYSKEIRAKAKNRRSLKLLIAKQTVMIVAKQIVDQSKSLM